MQYLHMIHTQPVPSSVDTWCINTIYYTLNYNSKYNARYSVLLEKCISIFISNNNKYVCISVCMHVRVGMAH